MSTLSPHFPLEREALRSLIGTCLHPARSTIQADLYALTREAEGWVLKDFSARPMWVRVLLIRRVMRREMRALRGLGGLDGIPRLAGAVGPDAFAMERLDADRLPHMRDNFLTPVFFDRLEALVDRMHSLGWAHGDLRRKNILVDGDLRPFLVDFATAFHAGPGAGPLRRWLFRRWAHVDRVSVARIKASYLPADLTPRDRALIDGQPAYVRVGRWMRKTFYRPLKKRHRRDFWRRLRGLFRTVR
ncbi:hypothetical protein JW916_05920 [Candidatus Sumerlaeota bacterium]|nr:hypothetical protein [Candidatus Sumerlaeota bacterium]